MKLLRVLFIAAFLLSGFAVVENAHAESKNKGSAYLTKVGLDHYEKGQVNDAIHELNKALMLDPTNKEAKKALMDMGIDHQIYHGLKTKNTEIIEMTRHLGKYKRQIATLMKEKEILQNKLNELLLERDTVNQMSVSKDLEMELLQVKLDETARVYNKEQEVKIRQIEQIEDIYMAKLDDLRNDVNYQDSLNYKKRLVARERALREKEAHFQDINAHLTNAVKQLIVYEDHLNVIDKLYYNLRDHVTTKRAIDTEMLGLLEENLEEQKKIINDLKDDLVFNVSENKEHAE